MLQSYMFLRHLDEMYKLQCTTLNRNPTFADKFSFASTINLKFYLCWQHRVLRCNQQDATNRNKILKMILHSYYQITFCFCP